jgi:hypothetical protein
LLVLINELKFEQNCLIWSEIKDSFQKKAQDEVMDSLEVYPNAAFTNEPTKCKLRASHSKKPLDKNEDFLWY